MGIFTPGISKVAYSGRLTCPVCHSEAIKYMENIGPTRLRYRCRKCGMKFQYEISSNMGTHPYAPFANKAKFRQIVDLSNIREKIQKK